MKNRLDWDAYFLEFAKTAAKRSSCPRASVGAAVIRNRRVVSLGYNGAVVGAEDCYEAGCIMYNNHCIRSVHAEANALLFAQQEATTRGAELYCTHRPCVECSKLIVNAGIVRVVYEVPYLDDRVRAFKVETQDGLLESFGIQVVQLKKGVIGTQHEE